jgi:tetratricopeptide (TPR) repeat protein
MNDEKIEAIATLQRRLEQATNEEERLKALFELGVACHDAADLPRALNHFNAVLRLNPGHQQARARAEIIHNVLNFYCKDLLNP